MCNEKAGLYGQDQIDLVVGIRYIVQIGLNLEVCCTKGIV